MAPRGSLFQSGGGSSGGIQVGVPAQPEFRIVHFRNRGVTFFVEFIQLFALVIISSLGNTNIFDLA